MEAEQEKKNSVRPTHFPESEQEGEGPSNDVSSNNNNNSNDNMDRDGYLFSTQTALNHQLGMTNDGELELSRLSEPPSLKQSRKISDDEVSSYDCPPAPQSSLSSYRTPSWARSTPDGSANNCSKFTGSLDRFNDPVEQFVDEHDEEEEEEDDQFYVMDELQQSHRTTPIPDIQFSNSIQIQPSEITDSSAHFSWVGSVGERMRLAEVDERYFSLHQQEQEEQDVSAARLSSSLATTTTTSLQRRTTTPAPQTLLEGHTNGIVALSISWDGSMIVTGSRDTTARVWDTSTSKCVAILRKVHSQTVLYVALSNSRPPPPRGDEEAKHEDTAAQPETLLDDIPPNLIMVGVASQDNTASLWVAQTGLLLHRLRGHTQRVHAVCWATDDTKRRRVVTGSRDDTVRVWNAATGLCVQSIHARQRGVRSLDVNKSFVVTGGYDRSAKIWNITHATLLHVFSTNHEGWIQDVQWFHDGATEEEEEAGLPNRILTTSRSGIVSVWRVHLAQLLVRSSTTQNTSLPTSVGRDGVPVVEFSYELTHSGAFKSAALAMDGDLIVTCSQDRVVLHDSMTGGELQSFPCFGAHDRLAATVDSVASSLESTSFGRSSAGHAATAVVASLDGSILVAAVDGSNAPSVWNASMGEVRYDLAPHKAPVTGVVVSDDGRRLVSTSEDSALCFWNIADVTKWSNPGLGGDSHEVPKPFLVKEGRFQSSSCVYVTSDGSLIVTVVSHERCVKIWDATSGHQLHQVPLRGGAAIQALVMTYVRSVFDESMAGSRTTTSSATSGQSVLLTGGLDGVVRCCDAATGKVLYAVSKPGPIQSIVSDGSHFVTTCHMETKAHVWDLASGTRLVSLTGHERAINDLAIATLRRPMDSGPTAFLATASSDATARLYDLTTFDTHLVLRGHKDSVLCVSASSTSRVVTSSQDKTLKLWDAINGSCLLTLQAGGTHDVTSISLSGDGLRLVAGSRDGSMRLWMMDTIVETGSSWRRYNSDTPPSSLTVNDRFLASLEEARRNPEYTWDWLAEFDATSLVFPLVTDVVHFDPYLEMSAAERSMLLQPSQATFENPLHLAVRHGDDAAVYFERMLRIVPQEAVRRRHGPHIPEPDTPTKSKRRRQRGVVGKTRTQTGATSNNDCTPHDRGDRLSLLRRALDSRSKRCTGVILDVYRDLLSSSTAQNMAPALHVFQGNAAPRASKFGPHVADSIDVGEVCLVAKQFPIDFVDFVKSLRAVPNYAEANQDLPVVRFPAGETHLLAGSEKRLPRGRVLRSMASRHRGSDDDDDDCESFWKQRVDERSGDDNNDVSARIGRLCCLGSSQSAVCSVAARIVPLKNVAGLGSDGKPTPFLYVVVKTALRLHDYSVFSNEIVRFVVWFKWDTFVRRMVMRDTLLYAALFVLLLVASVSFPSLAAAGASWSVWALGVLLETVVAVLTAYFVKIEYDKMQYYLAVPQHYWLDGWNLVMASSLGLQTVSAAGRLFVYVTGQEQDLARLVTAATMPLLAFQAVRFLRRGGGGGGSFSVVRTLLYITRGIMPLLFVLLVFVVAFASSAFVLHKDNNVGVVDDNDNDYKACFSTYSQSLLTVFGMVFGNYYAQAAIGESSSFSTSPVLSCMLLVTFVVLSAIVWWRVLIVVMMRLCSNHHHDWELCQEQTLDKALLILEYEGRIRPSQRRAKRHEWYPRWIQVLERKCLHDNDNDKTTTTRPQHHYYWWGQPQVGANQGFLLSKQSVVDNVENKKKRQHHHHHHYWREENLAQIRAEVSQVREDLIRLRQNRQALDVQVTALLEALEISGGIPS